MKHENDMRDNIIESISHEFLTPLNGQVMLLNIIENSKDIPAQIIDQYVQPAL